MVDPSPENDRDGYLEQYRMGLEAAMSHHTTGRQGEFSLVTTGIKDAYAEYNHTWGLGLQPTSESDREQPSVDEQIESSQTARNKKRVTPSPWQIGAMCIILGAVVSAGVKSCGSDDRSTPDQIFDTSRLEKLRDECFASDDNVGANQQKVITQNMDEFTAMGANVRVTVPQNVNMGRVMVCGAGAKLEVRGKVEEAFAFGADADINVSGSGAAQVGAEDSCENIPGVTTVIKWDYC